METYIIKLIKGYESARKFTPFNTLNCLTIFNDDFIFLKNNVLLDHKILFYICWTNEIRSITFREVLSQLMKENKLIESNELDPKERKVSFYRNKRNKKIVINLDRRFCEFVGPIDPEKPINDKIYTFDKGINELIEDLTTDKYADKWKKAEKAIAIIG